MNLLPPKKALEASFTLFETLIALMIMAVVSVELMTMQGNYIYFSEYSSNVTRAGYLAKRVMSQVEYYWQSKPFAEIKQESTSESEFEDFPDFKYLLTIKDWKLPIVDLIVGGGPAEKGEDGKEVAKAENPNAGAMGEGLKQVFGDESPLKIAHVEVFWAEGAKRNSTTLTYLLTNQKKVDQQLVLLKSAYDDLKKITDQANKGTASSSTTPPSGSTGQVPGGVNQ